MAARKGTKASAKRPAKGPAKRGSGKSAGRRALKNALPKRSAKPAKKTAAAQKLGPTRKAAPAKKPVSARKEAAKRTTASQPASPKAVARTPSATASKPAAKAPKPGTRGAPLIAAPPKKYEPDALENQILAFWDRERVFERSIEQRRDAKPFVFLEGPPTANGLPHAGHVLTRTLKDTVCRYQAMNGHLVLRKAGWDCHGLPVEIEVEKSLGLKSKGDIERYGIEAFNAKCRDSVFRYRGVWETMSRRVGFFLDFQRPYVTMDNAYIESVWWSLKRIWEKGLLYKGYRVTPHCPRCGTALSSHEVAQGYKEVEDPSLFVKFAIKGEANAYFLAWTTTPWTLVSNVALAVNPKARYVRIQKDGDQLVLAEERFQELYKKDPPPVLERFEGSQLAGKSYEPLYRYTEPEPGKRAWEVIAADFVSLVDGTGIVHVAPAFGEDDYKAGVENGLSFIQLVDLEGKFKPEARDFAGLWIKDADPRIMDDLKARGLLEGRRTVTHTYPFCWRCETPLLYYARESWFIAMTRLRDKLIENNHQVEWYPDHVKEGRFGDFLREVRDWSLSRDRYWGTPLPVWTCDGCGKSHCVGSVAELRERALNADALEPLDLHKPHIDRIRLKCESCGGSMARERSVIDAWYDSGAAPFAQWHYPFEAEEEFQENFPVDFICEGLDQTRGWFYSLMAIATALFETPAYKAVGVNGLVLDKEGQKMSKSKRNYTDPDALFRTLGADAVRWYLLSTSALWQPKRFFEDAVRETLSKYALTMWNTYSFFATYANLDAWDPRRHAVALEDRPALDRWLASRLTHVAQGVEQAMAKYELHKATRLIEEFLVDDLSNWWLRRSRRRFWGEDDSTDKRAAYTTLREALLGVAGLSAPFAPFLGDFVYGQIAKEGPVSVHLTDYPKFEGARADLQLEGAMGAIRRFAELGRALRAKANVKVRHPLPETYLVLGATGEAKGAAGAPAHVTKADLEPLLDILADELNVKTITFVANTEPFLTVNLKGNPGALGPKFRANARKVADAVAAANPEKAYAELQRSGAVRLDVGGDAVELAEADLVVTKVGKEGYALGMTEHGALVLDTRRSPHLMAEGLARELVRRIQEMRKELGLRLDDRIATSIEFRSAVEEDLSDWTDFIADETRSASLQVNGKATGDLVKEWNVDGDAVAIGVSVARTVASAKAKR